MATFRPASKPPEHALTCDNNPTHLYIEESNRPLGVTFKEHLNLDKPTGVSERWLANGHSVSMGNTTVLSREQEWHGRVKSRRPFTSNNMPHHES